MKYDSKLPILTPIKDHEILNINNIYSYFVDILDDAVRICSINDMCCMCDICDLSPDGLWLKNGELDICPSCINTGKGKEMINNQLGNHNNWQMVEMKGLDLHILDWIPVLRDVESYACVFYNINPNAEQYHQVLLVAVDNHGRQGYFNYPGTLDEVLNKIKTEERNSDCPIHLLLNDAGHELYYG